MPGQVSRMRAVVTGATGLIGHAIVSELVAAGHGVRAVVRDGRVTDGAGVLLFAFVASAHLIRTRHRVPRVTMPEGDRPL
jgi:nucleoside-diphosphate-sugar epimerase